MAQFGIAIAHTLKHEGGYNDIAEDKGGATNFGISLRFYQNNINSNANNDVIKNLTEEEACKIYKKFFWDFNNLDAILNQQIASKLFDSCVNMGNQQAIKLSQRVCNIKDDGFCGKITIENINKQNTNDFINKYIGLQENFYLDLIKNNPSQEKFKNGWLNRARYNGK